MNNFELSQKKGPSILGSRSSLLSLLFSVKDLTKEAKSVRTLLGISEIEIWSSFPCCMMEMYLVRVKTLKVSEYGKFPIRKFLKH